MDRKRLTLTVEETGEVLGISRALAYELVRRNELPSVRLGRRIVVPVHQLLAMLDGDTSRGAGIESVVDSPVTPADAQSAT